MKAYVAPADKDRCRATRKPLKDGSTPRCMRRVDQSHCLVCHTHRQMFRNGLPLVDHVTGEGMTSIIAMKR